MHFYFQAGFFGLARRLKFGNNRTFLKKFPEMFYFALFQGLVEDIYFKKCLRRIIVLIN